MVDMSQTIAPKSDQLNADDLIGGPRTITVTRVSGNEGNAEQPVNIFFEGDNGKPFRPCKSMRRVMVKIWGADASKYPGNSMTIYRDPKVKWGGMEVGGIRISHMTGIDQKQTMALTESKQARKPYTVQPLKVEPKADKVADGVKALIERIDNGEDVASEPGVIKQREWLQKNRPELAAEVEAALASRESEADDNPFGGDVPDDDVKAEPPVDKIRRMISAAQTGPDLDAANNLLNQHRSDIDGDTLADLDSSIADKRDEVG